MKITRITVHAGRTFNHPYERYANFRFDLSLEADLTPEADTGLQLMTLQRLAEGFADEHKVAILNECTRIRTIDNLRERVRDLQRPLEEWMSETPEQRATALEHAKQQLAEAEQTPPLCGVDIEREKEVHPGHEDHPETGASYSSEP